MFFWRVNFGVDELVCLFEFAQKLVGFLENLSGLVEKVWSKKVLEPSVLGL